MKSNKIYENNTLTLNYENEKVEIKMMQLTGSEKQIAWAEQIRLERLESVVDQMEEMGIEGFKKAGKLNTAQEVFDKVLENNRKYDWFMKETSAHEIIEARENGAW